MLENNLKTIIGRINNKVLEQFRAITKDAIKEVINDRMKLRLQIAEQKETEDIQNELQEEQQTDRGISTTEDEMDGFHVVRAILRNTIDVKRVAHRDTKSYFGILLDDNNRKPICRLFVEGNNWYLGLFDKNRDFQKYAIESIDDIYKYSDQLIYSVQWYDNPELVEEGGGEIEITEPLNDGSNGKEEE